MTTPAENKTSSYTATNHYVTRNRNTGTVTASGNVSNQLNFYRKVRPQSVKNAVRADGTRAPSNWSHTWSRALGLNGTFVDYSGTSSEISTYGPLLVNNAIWSVDTSMVNGLMRNARLKALSKSTEAVASSNAALYQAKDLVKMSRQYLSRAAKGLDDLWEKHGGSDLYKQAIRQGKEIPSDYLAYLYGIAPLGDDIAGCLDRITNYRTKGYAMSMILKAEKKVTSTVRRSAAIRHGTGTRNIRFPCKATTACRVGYRFDLPSWFMDRAPTVTPFSTAWQLTRMSFVLDWFLPVGDYIGALESAQFSPFFKEGFEVSFVQESAQFSQAECTDGVRPRINLRGRSINGTMQRTVIKEYPSSIMTRPALNPIPGVDKVAQGLSLLTQALKRWR